MDWIQILGNNDSTISDIQFTNDSFRVVIKTWDCKEKQLVFADYIAVKVKNAIGEEIGDIIVRESSFLLDEVRKDNEDTEDSLEELSNAKSIMFASAWNERELIDIIVSDISHVYESNYGDK